MSPNEKAEALLWSKLTDAQRNTFTAGYFDVTGSRGGRYRISMTSTVQNITSIPRLGLERGFCAGPSDPMPSFDVWLCQKLLIESDEDRFLRVAGSWINGISSRYW